MMGGRDWENDKVNLALGREGGGSGRQAGSAFKPIVLAEAVQQGISLNTKFRSPGQMTFPGANAGADWVVRNYAGTEQGVLDLADATRVSSNTAYAQLMLEVGPAAVVDMARQLGIRAERPPVTSRVLGTGEVSVLDMAVAYSTFANRGVRYDPIMITRVEQVDEEGRTTVLDTHASKGQQVLTEQEADLVTYCLRLVVTAGTGRAADIGRPVAGRPAPPRRTATPGSSGTGPASPPRCGWATSTPARATSCRRWAPGPRWPATTASAAASPAAPSPPRSGPSSCGRRPTTSGSGGPS